MSRVGTESAPTERFLCMQVEIVTDFRSEEIPA